MSRFPGNWSFAWVQWIALFSVVSCQATTGSSEARSGYSETLHDEVLPRATFDLNCPVYQLTARCLDADCYEAGVEGCGKRATYVYRRTGGAGMGMGAGQWIMNNAIDLGDRPGPTPAAAKAPARTAKQRPESEDVDAGPLWAILAQGKTGQQACTAVAAELVKDEACKREQCRAAAGVAGMFFGRCKGADLDLERLKEARESWKDQIKHQEEGARCLEKLLKALESRAALRTYEIRCLEDRSPGHVESLALEAAKKQAAPPARSQ